MVDIPVPQYAYASEEQKNKIYYCVWLKGFVKHAIARSVNDASNGYV